MEFTEYLFSMFGSGEVLAWIGIILAYWAYAKSLRDGVEDWISILSTFKEELLAQSTWLRTPYDASSFSIEWGLPWKVVYPLVFNAGESLLRKGRPPFDVATERFSNNLAFFMERVSAFNDIREYQKILQTSNPKDLYLVDSSFQNFTIKAGASPIDVYEAFLFANEKDDTVVAMSSNLKIYNQILHREIIGNKNNPLSLHSLYTYFVTEIDNIVDNYKENIPYWIIERNQLILSVLAIFDYYLIKFVLSLVIEIYLK